MKKPKKFKSAEEKQHYLRLVADWEKLKQAHATRPARNLKSKKMPKVNPRIAELRKEKSLDTGVKGAVTLGVEVKVYTGDNMIGIAIMHKSNLVPIFNSDAAEDVSKMRR